MTSTDNQLIDPFNREIKYLRVSVTDKCNLRCTYCMPEEGYHSKEKYTEYLNFEEIERICRSFVDLGVKHIRITGGEPLVRPKLHQLIKSLNDIDNNLDLSLSTNALKLDRQAETLFNSGVKRLNISIDTLNEKDFSDITRGGSLKKVLSNIKIVKKIGFKPIKINTVIMRDFNDHQIEPLIDWALKNELELRFIEIMPIGESGINQMQKHIPAKEIIERVEKHCQTTLIPTVSKHGAGPAKYHRIAGYSTGIGIISAVSQHFCDTCNRVRLTAKGQLALCLGQEDNVDLRKILRDGVSDEQLKQIIVDAIKLKPEKHFFKENRQNIQFRQMVSLGG